MFIEHLLTQRQPVSLITNIKLLLSFLEQSLPLYLPDSSQCPQLYLLCSVAVGMNRHRSSQRLPDHLTELGLVVPAPTLIYSQHR